MCTDTYIHATRCCVYMHTCAHTALIYKLGRVCSEVVSSLECGGNCSRLPTSEPQREVRITSVLLTSSSFEFIHFRKWGHSNSNLVIEGDTFLPGTLHK